MIVEDIPHGKTASMVIACIPLSLMTRTSSSRREDVGCFPRKLKTVRAPNALPTMGWTTLVWLVSVFPNIMLIHRTIILNLRCLLQSDQSHCFSMQQLNCLANLGPA